MTQAGWLTNADGTRATFAAVARQVLVPMGVTEGYIRQYLSKAYEQQNWLDFCEELERQAHRYQKKRLQR